MNIVIIKYNAGNIQSVKFALQRIGIEPEITSDPLKIQSADKVIFPGVGEANSTMKYLREHKMDKLILSLKQPVLGICLGLQLMCKYSEEGDTPCLGIFDEIVLKFKQPVDMINSGKIPHMGWNNFENTKGKLFINSQQNDYVYFVHSYYATIGSETVASTNYLQPFSSALQKGNFYATQFHPEKSGVVGERILDNFIKL